MILANEVLGADLRREDVFCEGISAITPQEVRDAASKGLRWKLVGSATRHEDGSVEAPLALPAHHPLAGISGPVNAVSFRTDLLGAVTVSGPGAGRVETAYALLSDIIAIHQRHADDDTAPTLPVRLTVSDTIVTPGIELDTDTAPVHNPYTGEIIASVPTVDAGAVGSILQQARCGRRTAAALSRLLGCDPGTRRPPDRAARRVLRSADRQRGRQDHHSGPQGGRPRGQHPVPVRGRGMAQRRRGHPLRLL